MTISLCRRGAVLGFVLSVAACNSVLDIEEAQSVSEDQDLTDDQEERGGFALRETSPKPIVAESGAAASSCPANQKLCFDKCVAIDDPRYGCAPDSCTSCAFAHTKRSTCTAGQCAVLECDVEWANCNGDSADGCETDLFNSRSCGACGNQCPERARFCVAMTCSPTAQ